MRFMSDARNEIEKKLLDAQEGRLDTEQFMEALLAAQLFMPVHDGSSVMNIQRSAHAQPLTIEGEDGGKSLVLFTSPDRARTFVPDHPGYSGGILTDLPWIFENLGVGFGILLNPGHDIGLDIEADTVAQLSQQTH